MHVTFQKTSYIYAANLIAGSQFLAATAR